MKKVVGLILGLVPVAVSAECVPVPDCASIGYTETSCDGDSVKCPFDTTKLKCIPCDSSFRYSCSGENIKNPIGDACNNKYAACECVDRTTFVNGECVCDTSCDTIGNIVYSDNSCSSCLDNTKTAVAVIVHSDSSQRIIIPTDILGIGWASASTDVSTITDLSEEEAKLDMNGAENSLKIRNFFTGDNETNNAAWYCYNLEIEGFEHTKNQWYLPAVGELLQYIINNSTILQSTFSILGKNMSTQSYWTSSEAPCGTWSPYLSGRISYMCNNPWANLAVACFYAWKK